MITGVYAKENFEIAISKHFKVIHYLIDDNYGVKLYKDNKLINAEVINSERIEFADGELRFTPKECGQDYFKVFLLENIESLLPYKKAEQFTITQQ